MMQVPATALERVESLLASGRRRLLGLVGAPGSGKSTFAAALQAAFGERAQVVPMDGFHLANVELTRLGRAERKGAPDTFDQAGYGTLLERLRSQDDDEIVYAPEFRREIEEPVAGAIAVLPQTQLIISEGNYLLHWHTIAPLFDEVWYIDVDEALRHERLVRRHEQFGRSPEAARAWVAATDEPNARLIEARRVRAHHVVHLGA
ncbi:MULTISPECIES: nucleoside/nucleotide kinase family protein [unclassified Variovorax]|uniref:nucleoside/nucleotide kinase family protein n=1 Tax=unclassified Variovorax TaxID=663243 RepID=UPI001BD6DABF|nr:MULTISPECIES: nucleoside/nucleotide kinase family protein [unclassified Variovorax]